MTYLDDINSIVTTKPDDLEHAGVRGMRWGVRKKSSASASEGDSGKRKVTTTEAAKTISARKDAKKHSTDVLTNLELKDSIARMNLEAQYKTLTRSPARRIGANLAGNILKATTTAAASAVINQFVNQKLATKGLIGKPVPVRKVIPPPPSFNNTPWPAPSKGKP